MNPMIDRRMADADCRFLDGCLTIETADWRLRFWIDDGDWQLPNANQVAERESAIGSPNRQPTG
jgi:hypothetical protein